MKERHVYVDGASLGNPGRSGAGIVAYDEDGAELWRESIRLGEMTNNMAEYEALINGLKRVQEHTEGCNFFYTDSLLVANHFNGSYKVRNQRLARYLEEARFLAGTLHHFVLKYVPREQNRVADRLAKEAAQRTG